MERATVMANSEHLQLFRDPQQWEEWRLRFPDIVPDLRASDISSLDHMSGRNVQQVDWSDADLSYMDLADVNFERGIFTHAFLNSSQLCNASFAFADMCQVDLSFARCRGVNLSHANPSSIVVYICIQCVTLYRYDCIGMKIFLHFQSNSICFR